MTNYNYFKVQEADTIEQAEMKEKKNKKRVTQTNEKTKRLLETKFSRRNLIKGINTWAVSLVRYSRPFLK